MKGLILTYLVAFTATFGALRSPLLGLYVYVGFAVMRPQAIFGWAGDMEYLSFAVGVATLLGWFFSGFGDWKLKRSWPIVGFMILFCLWFVMSAAMALDTARAWRQVNEFSKLALPFLVGVTVMREEKQWVRMFWIIVACQGYVSYEQNVNYLWHHKNTAAEGFGGMDNNFFALSLVTCIGPAVGLIIASKTWRERLIAFACAGLILHTLLLTFSRGGFLGLICVGLVAFVMMPKRPKNLLAVGIGIALTIRLTGPQLAERYATIWVPEEQRDASAESRVDLWRDCILVIREYPYFGVGPGNWRVIADRYGWPPGKSAHSVWMESAAENGLPGAGFLLLFFVTAAMKLWPLARQKVNAENRYDTALAAGSILAITGFVVSGQFVSAPSLEVPYYVVMAACAMVTVRPKRARILATDVAADPNAAASTAPRGFNPPPRPAPAPRIGPGVPVPTAAMAMARRSGPQPKTRMIARRIKLNS
jgi:O-antigen ligase